MIEFEVDSVLFPEPQAFQHRQIACKPDRGRRENNVECDRESELNSRKLQCCKAEHKSSPFCVAMFRMISRGLLRDRPAELRTDGEQGIDQMRHVLIGMEGRRRDT